MNTELRNNEHSSYRLFGWMGFYVLIVMLVFLSLFFLASKIRTHTLPVGQIHLVVPHSQYVVGEPITFQITNNLNAAIYVQNKCPTEPLDVYIQKNGAWVRIHESANINECPKGDRQVAIAANSTLTGNFNSWPNLFKQPGHYRIVALVEHYNALPYQDFEVITPPAPAPEPVATPVATQPQPSNVSSQSSGSQSQSSTALKSKTISTSKGSISVQYSASQIYVLSINPASGCKYEGGRSGPRVQVTFKCNGSELQVSLSLRNGQLVQNIENGGD
jgi:hypothetical protein